MKVLLAAAGAVAARAALRAAAEAPRAHRLQRTNFRGRTVTLAGGPALAAAASLTSAAGAGSPAVAAAALAAGLGSGAVGFYDDVVGGRPEHQAKGFKGHLGALRQGRVTSGLIKIAGVGASAAVAAGLLGAGRGRGRARHAAHFIVDLGLVAGAANLINLLDLRPGRALKAGVLLGTPLALGRGGGLAAGPVGAATGLLEADLDERAMLGDAGANALGALLGVAVARRSPLPAKLAVLGAVAGLTAASEKVSFTRVIERTPVLRELDELGRRSR